MHRNRGSLTVLLVTLQWVGYSLAAPLTDPLVRFDLTFDRQGDRLLPELELRLLQEQRQQDDMEVLRMQLLQMNLLKLLVGLDLFILICIYYYGREEKYYRVQAV
ncbi:hypothetical protein KR009_004371 [Drosophila setifemur]|nr:hypothetical protein KR009_004371 [Drosophila setifemur]